MARLTDTQLVILSSASQRNDRVDLPTNITGEALFKQSSADELIHGLSNRDVEAGPMALRITKQGLEVEPGAFRTDWAGRSMSVAPVRSVTMIRRSGHCARLASSAAAIRSATRSRPLMRC